MTTATPANGRAKKSLEHQLDRLDGILDGLAEALNGAVADAVKEAVGAAVAEAVRAVLAEILTNPAVAAGLAEAKARAPDTPAPAGPTRWWDRLRAGCRRARAAAGAVSVAVAGRVTAVGRAVTGRMARPVVGWLRRLRAGAIVARSVAVAGRRVILPAVAAGVVVGAGCYVAGPFVAGLVGGLSGTVTVLTAAVVRPLWPLLRSVRPAQPVSPGTPGHTPAS